MFYLQEDFEDGLEFVLGVHHADMHVLLGGFVVAFVDFQAGGLPQEVGLAVAEFASDHNLVLHD